MYKASIISILTLISFSVFSDASIDISTKENSFLITAPGTVTGTRESSENDLSATIAKPTVSVQKQSPLPPVRRYKYVGENKKFRQFGQYKGQNNPWFEDYNIAYPRQSQQPNGPAFKNPWQLGGMPHFQGLKNSAQRAFSNKPSSNYGATPYYGSDQLYPDFPDGIYRDTNPAAMPAPGFNKGYMSGFGSRDSGFPFSPFGMF